MTLLFRIIKVAGEDDVHSKLLRLASRQPQDGETNPIAIGFILKQSIIFLHTDIITLAQYI